MKKLLICLLLIASACNNRTNNDIPSEQQTNSNENFVGVWKYYTSSYEKNKNPNDHSMEGSMIRIKLVEDTKETYQLNLDNMQPMIFSRVGNKLIGENTTISVAYDGQSGHIIMHISENSWEEFSKLK